MKYTLKKPVKLGEQGEPVTELVFREEVVSGDVRGIKMSHLADPDSDDILKVAGRLCAQTDAVMSRLSWADFEEVTMLVVGFWRAGRETGTKP